MDRQTYELYPVTSHSQVTHQPAH